MRKNLFLLTLMLSFLGGYNSYAQKSESFFYRPGLEIALPRAEWEIKRQTYDEAMWHPGQRHLRNESKQISIRFSCDLVENLEIVPDSFFWLTEERIKFAGQSFQKEVINGFTLYLIHPPHTPGKHEYVAEALHPWGHFASMSFEIPSKNQKDANAVARDIIAHMYLRTPKEIDQLLGLPYPPNLNRDSLVAARKDEIREKSKGQYPKDYVEAELKKLKPEDLLWDAMDGYCWDKIYRLRAQISAGDLPLDAALDHEFLGITSPDIALFQNEFRIDGGGLYTGISKLVARSLRPAIDPSQFDFHLSSKSKFYDRDETYYWSLADSKDSMSCLLISYHRVDTHWTINYARIGFPFPTYGSQIIDNLEETDEDPHDWTGVPKFPKQHRLNIVRIWKSEQYDAQQELWVFNAMVPTTNILHLPNLLPPVAQFDVTYLITSLTKISGRARQYQPKEPPNFRDSTAFVVHYGASLRSQCSFEKVLHNKTLKEKICTVHHLCEYFSPKNPNSEDPNRAEDWSEEQKKLENAAVEILAADIAPAKRRYQSPLLFTDLDHDGNEEMIAFTVSNGELLDYFGFEALESGVEAITPSADWRQLIANLPACKMLSRVSLVQSNILARFGESPW